MAVKILKSILHFLNVSFILFVLFLFILIIGLPTYVCRYIIKIMAQIFRPDLGKMLTTVSSLPGVDDIYVKPKQSIVFFCIAKGQPTYEELLQHCKEVIEAKDPVTGQDLFVEMRQYVTRWCGFLFWKWDTKFDVTNHFRYYSKMDADNPNPDLITEEMVQDIGSSITYSPFVQKRSPWEALFFPNVKIAKPIDADDVEETERHCALILHAHHSLGDGFAFSKFLNFKFTGNMVLDVQKSNFKIVPPKMHICKRIFILFKAPYDFISESIRATDPLNEWHLPEEKLTRKHNASFSLPIDMSYIKEIKNAYHVAFGSVLICAFTGAIRRFMIEAGHGKVPEAIHCIHPLPMPSHPDKMRNHMTACFVRLPLEISDSKERLLNIDKSLLEARDNTLYPLAMYYYMVLLGGLWASIIKCFAKNTLCTAFMSNFPGNNKEAGFPNFTCTSGYFSAGFARGNIGMGFASISYKGFIRVVAGMDEGIVSSDKLPAKELIKYFMEELDRLKREAV